jgi:hypothetical protein
MEQPLNGMMFLRMFTVFSQMGLILLSHVADNLVTSSSIIRDKVFAVMMTS